MRNIKLDEIEISYLRDLIAGRIRPDFWTDEKRAELIGRLNSATWPKGN